MFKQPKISVIVPVWGVEQYIEKCARSLFESSCEDMEFIFVDDCTPDKSIEVLRNVMADYPQRYENIHIIQHQKNKGLPQARKTGVEASRGEWITFCDSDDWVDKEMYERMLRKGDECDYDMIFCDFVYLTDDKIIWKPTYSSYDSYDKLRNGFLNCKISNAVWTKIVKRKLYEENNIYFPYAAMDEDDVLTSQWAFYSKKIGYVNECLYYHYANPKSMTHEEGEENIIKRLNERILNRGWIISFLESREENTLKEIIYNNKRIVKLAICNAGQTRQFYKQMVNTYKEINKDMILGKERTIKERIINLLLLASYPTYKLVASLRNKR